MPRVLLIGLDSVPPLLAFDRYRPVMPNLAQLIASGCHARLQSTTPPITVPAWASLLSGYDPGELGIYGFRNRAAGSHQLQLVSSADVSRPMVWDRLAPGQRACVLFAPPSYPPREVPGELVSCFLTPSADVEHTWPAALGGELRARFGAYQPDVVTYRTEDLPRLLEDVYAGTAQRFAIAEHMLRTRRADLTVFVEIGPDRFHHALWAHIDPDHPRHVPGNPYANAGRDYYRFLDHQLGKLLAAVGGGPLEANDTAVLVMSDHGMRPLLGCIHVNQWLIERGYLVLEREPAQLTPFAALEVDWRRTRAYAEGGYYARIMLNVAGRDPAGIVAASSMEQLLGELTQDLNAMPGPSGEQLAHRVVRPRDCYRETRGLPPDLMAFFGDLAYRASGQVGGGVLHSDANDQGPDACNHDWQGIFVMSGAGVSERGDLGLLDHSEVAPRILALLRGAA